MSEDNEANEIKIYLTKEEIELFKLFRKFQTDFMIMLYAGLFDFKNGMYEIHRDQNGVLQDIVSKLKPFTRKKGKIHMTKFIHKIDLIYPQQ